MATIKARDGKIKFTDDAKTIRQLAEENKANLQGADLLGADLLGANLERANLERANLWGANLGGAKITKSQIDAIILGIGVIVE